MAELKRRQVLRVGVAYLAAAWLLIQVAETLLPVFGFPATAMRVLVVVLAIGFVVALVLSWYFELTPEGIRPDKKAPRDRPGQDARTRRFDRGVGIVLLVAVAYFAFDKFVLAPQRTAELAQEARETGRSEGAIGVYGENSIAVLPFDDLSPEGNQAWFAEGIAEELLNLLARIDGLRVISRSSSFAFHDQELSVPEIAERLRVRYVLEGSVRTAGNVIRITAQLIDAGSDAHVWSKTYDREFADVFAIQDEISAQVVSQLRLNILGDVPTAEVTSREAYELYLEGLPLLARRGDDDLQAAQAIFERVIAMEPGYAAARAAYAATLFWQSRPSSDVSLAAQQTLDVDPRNADALALLGRSRGDLGHDVEGEALLRQAIEINPNHPYAYRWLGTLNTHSDSVAYLRYARKAFELHPTDPSIRFHTGYALALNGRFDEALREFESLAVGQRSLAFIMAAEVHMMAGNLERTLKAQYHFFREFGDVLAIPRTLSWLGETELAWQWALVRKAGAGPDDLQVIYDESILRLLEGDAEFGIRLFTSADERGVFTPGQPHLGTAYVLFGGDPARAVADFERALTVAREERPIFNRYDWENHLNYAIAMHRNGETERASAWFEGTENILRAQIAQGVVHGRLQRRLHEALASIHATRGEHGKAIAALRQAVALSGLSSKFIDSVSVYASLRDLPAFREVLADARGRNELARDVLAAEGLLLTPEALRALPEFNHDPFAR